MSDSLASNPLLQPWNTPYNLPPFDKVKPEHYVPAFDVAMAEHLRELDAIAANAAAPDFVNTVQAFDESGRLFMRVSNLFWNLTSSETSPALQTLEMELSPKLAAHANATYMHAGVFARIAALYARRDTLGLDSEQLRLLERKHLDFVRSGALLSDADRARYAELTEELATLSTQFSQNVLADESTFALTLTSEADLAGLPESVREAARSAAAERDLPEGSYAITLSPSIAEPFMTFSTRRDLRETIWRARVARGAHPGEHANYAIAARIIELRQQQAAMHGFSTYAEFKLDDSMARTPETANDLLMRAWTPALVKADADRARLTAMATELGEPTPIEAWDWRYLAERVRQTSYDLDDAELKPYFSLENMIGAMFDCAHRLFGVRFVEKRGVPLYHADARLWEVLDRTGKQIGTFIGDNYARQTKRGGAWMSIFQSQSAIDGGTLPIVINNNNFAKAERTLLSFDDVRTLFHEFGHGLHGLLSNVRYEGLAGTQVLNDFVELPSQIFENWAEEPEVLQRHARHIDTGEPIPAALLEKLKRARQFNQAWASVQYVGPALIDMALHSLPNGTPVDIAAFEAEQCAKLGVPADIGQRHYLSHFLHLFSSSSYAAGYYVYMWAEVLDADGYNAFIERGSPFDAPTAERLYRYVYSAGNSFEPGAAYRAFRGRDPKVEPMLAKRGLIDIDEDMSVSA
ncbi:peptidyl-dipeptidase Dcp [Pararobbsia alpina]|uniref:M3 family metallopeptidase n=1 Tax=Pararobbsia alpina TaxID=621374 RepID=UPI0039A5501A